MDKVSIPFQGFSLGAQEGGAMASEQRKKFKDWFDREAALAWVQQVQSVYPQFDGKIFERAACQSLDDLEFAARVQQFSDALAETLPSERSEAIDILRRSLPGLLPDCESPTDGWLQWPLGQFIADHGLEHYEVSMQAMMELTQRFTSEFAVRPFLESYPERVFQDFQVLCQHPNSHVRRWCSEGSRPRLPWGVVLKDLVRDPLPIFPILEALKDDPELYVRRSVANNLNDISKDHPELVVELCEKWSLDSNPLRDWLIKHALRGLVKDANPVALKILGFHAPQNLEVQLSLSPSQIRLNESLELQLRLKNRGKMVQKLQVDYVVHYVRLKDKISEKVFKWKTLEIDGDSALELSKKHFMKSTTIRALYPGSHRVEVQINGCRLAEASFDFANC